MAWSDSASGFSTYDDPTASARISADANQAMQRGQQAFQREMAPQGWANDQALANIGIQPAMLAANQRQDRFQRIFPWLRNQYNTINSQMATAGGQSGASPEISVGGVLNPSQIQQQINGMRAGNDQNMQGLMTRNSQQTAGRGFGSNSPLLAALNGQAQASNLATNTEGEREIRLGAAEKNAGQLLQSQQARESQFANRQNEDIRRRAPYFSMQNTLLSSLAGLV